MPARLGAALRLELILFILLLAVYVWPRDLDHGPNVNAHLGQALAIAVDGTLSIDNYAHSSFTYTIDWARAPDGRLYPAKAPGCALVLAPVIWGVVRAERCLGIDPLTGPSIWRKGVVGNWIVNALPSAFCMVLLFRLAQSLGLPAAASFAGVLGVALGTAYHPYATAFYAHAPAANLLVIAAAATFMNHKSRGLDVLGGMAAGFAVVFDYPAALAVLACAAALVALRGSAVLAFIAGGMLPLAILVTYHVSVFGSPWATPYQFQNPVFSPMAGSPFGAPDPGVLVALLVSPYRGVLFFSPVLLAILPGAVDLWRGTGTHGDAARQRKQRVYVAFSLVTAASWLLLNASYFTWTGGYTTGPRFVIPALVMLAPLLAAGWRRFPVITTVLLCLSASNQFAIAAVWLQAHDGYRNPLAEVIYPRLLSGTFLRGNLGLRLGLPGIWSLAPLAAAVMIAVVLAWVQIRSPDGRKGSCDAVG
jgi:hypothetical protein